MINTQVIYPPADGTAEALLAASSIDLAERVGRAGRHESRSRSGAREGGLRIRRVIQNAAAVFEPLRVAVYAVRNPDRLRHGADTLH